MSEINMFGMVELKNSAFDENLLKIKKEEEYKTYIDNHITNVIRAYNELKHNTRLNKIYNSNILEAFNLLDNEDKIINHDASKYSDAEFSPYRVRYYPATKEEKKCSDLDEEWEPYAEAWKHHYTCNDHHPEHWISENGVIHDMPLECIIEMICDWESFKYIGKGSAVQYWNKEKKNKIKIMSPYTIEQVEYILNTMK